MVSTARYSSQAMWTLRLRKESKGSHLVVAYACVAANRANKHVTPIWAAEARP
jgi:hypothetical protein